MKRSAYRGPLLSLLPISLWMVVFMIIPLVIVGVISFLSRSTYGGIDVTFTINNYLRVFDPLYIKIVIRSILVASITTFACLLIGYPFAWFVAKRFPGIKNFLLMLVIVPFWTNSLVRTYAWIVILRSEGLINSYLQITGLTPAPLELLYNDFAVILVMVYTFLPFMILPLYASIEKLDESLLEAAWDLGASPVYAFFHVTIPQTLSGIFAGSLLVFVPSLGIFFIPDLIGGGKSMLLSNLIKNQFLSARDWPFGAALSIVMIFLTLILIFLYIRFSRPDDREDLL